MRRGDDAGDAGVERKLQDHAPHRRRRVLHRAHQPRRRPVQQEAEQQEREVQDVEVQRVQRIAGLREVARRDTRRRARRPATSASGECSSRCAGQCERSRAFRALAGSAVLRSAVVRGRCPRSPRRACRRARRRRGEPHHGRRRPRSRPRPTARLCQRKIVWRNGMMPPGTRPPCATMSRICGCSAPGVAICSAADPLSPCAQMLPRPSTLAAASAR